MDEEKICPINPHGNGYCKREKCALWITDKTYRNGTILSDDSECTFAKLVSELNSISYSLDSLDSRGIGVYNQDDEL